MSEKLEEWFERALVLEDDGIVLPQGIKEIILEYKALESELEEYKSAIEELQLKVEEYNFDNQKLKSQLEFKEGVIDGANILIKELQDRYANIRDKLAKAEKNFPGCWIKFQENGEYTSSLYLIKDWFNKNIREDRVLSNNNQISEPYIRKTFTDSITIHLPYHSKVADCVFEKDSKIIFDEVGVVENCLFKGNIELESEYKNDFWDRKFRMNLLYKLPIILKGVISIENNIVNEGINEK